MNTKLIAVAAAFGIVFALASTSFAEERRPATAHAGSGKLKSGKIKRSATLNTSPSHAPEVRGGNLDAPGKPGESNGNVIYF